MPGSVFGRSEHTVNKLTNFALFFAVSILPTIQQTSVVILKQNQLVAVQCSGNTWAVELQVVVFICNKTTVLL